MPNRNTVKRYGAYRTIESWRTGQPTTMSFTLSSRAAPWIFLGFENPRWRQQIALKQDATTPYTAADSEIVFSREAHASSFRQVGSVKLGAIVSGSLSLQHVVTTPSTSDVAACDNLARTKFYQKMSSDFSAGTFLGELRETVKMMRRPASAFRDHLSTFRENAKRRRDDVVRRHRRDERFDESRARRDYHKAFTDSWLEASFGWRPLISDIEGFYQNAVKLLKQPRTQPFYVSVRGERFSNTSPIGPSGSGQGIIGTITRESYHDTRVSYGGAVFARVDSDMPILTSLGFANEQVVPVLWNLLPYSFLADYFANIGDVLDAWATAHSLRYAYCYRTLRLLQRSKVSCGYKADFGYILQDSSPGNLVFIAKTTSRASSGAVPIPFFEARVKLSTSRGLNMLALLGSKSADMTFAKDMYALGRRGRH